MTNEDEAMMRAIADQINSELGGLGWSVMDLARKMGRPYDSTRNYLVKERALPLPFLLEAATTIGVPAETIVARARAQQLHKYLEGDAAASGE
jgi:hypothetical protein